MLAGRRWRDWNPPESNEKSPENEPPKPPKPLSSVLSVPTLAISAKSSDLSRTPAHDPAEWREPFARWLEVACVRYPRGSGGIGCLHLRFCEWAIAHDEVPCNRLTFECLIREAGFVISDGLVQGLIRREVFEALE